MAQQTEQVVQLVVELLPFALRLRARDDPGTGIQAQAVLSQQDTANGDGKFGDILADEATGAGIPAATEGFMVADVG